jgi:phage shock protein E
MNKKWIAFFTLLIFFLQSEAQEKVYKDLSASEFKSKLETTQQEVLLDLRTPDEISKGVIPGSVNLDYFKKDFENQIAKLDHNKTYFLYCAVGGRSGETLELMKKLGFREVYNLSGGFTAWKKAKYPVEPPKK